MNKDFQNGFALGMATGGVVESEGVKLNIAYGETAPEDTSKLWVKANEPENLKVSKNIDGVESIRTSSAHLPTVCYGMGCARVGKKIYLFCGYNSSGSRYLNRIDVFDTDTETITTLSTSTTLAPCTNIDCASIGTKIYLFGGDTGSGYHLNTINVLDTETATLTKLSATLPTKYSGMGCASIGTKIYLFGGYTGYGSAIDTINVFDTETETITTLSTYLPKSCYNMGCASVGTKVYLFGGYGTELNTINVFDTETETIKTLSTTLPTDCNSMGCASIGNKIYLFGGHSTKNGTTLNTINVFDTETETITTLSTTLPTVCNNMGCASIGDKIYLLGGSGNGSLNTINCFTLTHELTHGNIELQSGLLNNKFNIINTENAQVEIGVENVFIGDENNEAETANAFLFVDGEWVQISFGRDQFAPEEPIGTYSERMYAHYGVDKTEYPYLLISTHSTYSRIEFFKERILENSSYFFRGYRYADVNVAEGSDIETIVASHEASDSSKLSVETGTTTSSSEIDNYTYYANFNYAELGYSGVGTWITIE